MSVLSIGEWEGPRRDPEWDVATHRLVMREVEEIRALVARTAARFEAVDLPGCLCGGWTVDLCQILNSFEQDMNDCVRALKAEL